MRLSGRVALPVTGGYVYFDVFSQSGQAETVSLVAAGANVTTRRPTCLSFWYAAFGAGEAAQLKLLIRRRRRSEATAAAAADAADDTFIERGARPFGRSLL